VSRRRLLRYVPVLGVVLVALLGASAVFGLRAFLGEPEGPPKKQVQQISLVKPPPPPKEEKPPEPEPPKHQDEKPLDINEAPPMPEQPVDTPDAPPPGPDLGLDAAGSAGSDSFGLVGKKGGQGLISGNGGEGNAHLWYAGLIKKEVQDLLNEHSEVRRNKYTVVVRVWVERDGRISQADLQGTTGDPAVDRALRTALTSTGRLEQPPPEDMPQPVRLRITSRL
jgi:protein TonB